MSAEPTDSSGDSVGEADQPRVLFVDNFDSFTYNLVEYVSEHAHTEVVRNTATLEDVRAADPDAIVISPGPGHPKNGRDVGVTNDVLTEISPEVPTLGVCLGHQALVAANGGTVGHAPSVVHGKPSTVEHDGRGIFDGLPDTFSVGRYHSLAATGALPQSLEATAHTTDDRDLVMAVRHREKPHVGVQFHPESILTDGGERMVRNFVHSCYTA